MLFWCENISCSVMSALCSLMDCSLPGSSVHGILQTRILEWVVIPLSRESSQPRDWTRVSCIVGGFFTIQFSSVQSLSHVRLFVTPWTAACQASLSITNSQNSLKLTNIELVMPSNCLILCCPFSSCPQSVPASESFPVSQLFTWGGQITGVSALASFLPKNTQGWSPLGLTGWISLQSKGLSRVFSNTTVQKHQFLGAQLSSQSNSYIHTWPLEKPFWRA